MPHPLQNLQELLADANLRVNRILGSTNRFRIGLWEQVVWNPKAVTFHRPPWALRHHNPWQKLRTKWHGSCSMACKHRFSLEVVFNDAILKSAQDVLYIWFWPQPEACPSMFSHLCWWKYISFVSSPWISNIFLGSITLELFTFCAIGKSTSPRSAIVATRKEFLKSHSIFPHIFG